MLTYFHFLYEIIEYLIVKIIWYLRFLFQLYAECLEVNSLLEVDQVCNVITQGYLDESAASQNANTDEETEIVNKLKGDKRREL